jgi:hypothetical protein
MQSPALRAFFVFVGPALCALLHCTPRARRPSPHHPSALRAIVARPAL